MTFYWLFLTIIFPGIAHTKKVTIESKNIKDMFHHAIKFGGDGIMWTIKNEEYPYTCSKNGDYMFLTNKINLTDTFTDTIYVTMETGFYDNFSKSLKIYLYANSQLPSTENTTEFLKFFLQNFSLVYSVENNTASMRRGDRWTHIFKFHKNESKIVTLGVRGTGVCARVYSMKVYYYYCEGINQNGVKFSKTMSPFDGQKKVEVNCSVSSSLSSHVRTFSGLCTYNGTWDIDRETRCFCKKGFERNSSNQCTPCRDGHFKPLSLNETCKRCPAKRTNTDDRTSCKCSSGYYDVEGDPTTTPCFGPIEEKFDISVKQIDKEAVNISWQAVLVKKEMSNSLRYDVECFLCENHTDSLSCNKICKNVKYEPRKENLTQTFVRISLLEPGNRYTFRVYPKTLIKFISKDHWNYSETRYQFPTTPTPNINSTERSRDLDPVKTKISVSTIAWSVAVCILAFLLIVSCGILIHNHKRHHLGIKDTIELRQNELAVQLSQNNQEHNYENPDELDIVLYEEVPNVVHMDKNRPDAEVHSNNLHDEQLALRAEYAASDNKETEPHKEGPNLTCSVLADADEKKPDLDNPQKEPSINDLVYIIPLDHQTDPYEGFLVAAPEERGTKNYYAFTSELLEDSDGYLLPAYGEIDPSRNAEISEPSAYAKLDENARKDRDKENAGNYQKLLRYLDYVTVIPADGETNP